MEICVAYKILFVEATCISVFGPPIPLSTNTCQKVSNDFVKNLYLLWFQNIQTDSFFHFSDKWSENAKPS